MAIIYSYPIVDPSANDLILGSDVDSAGKPTKNFTVQSIIDLVTVTCPKVPVSSKILSKLTCRVHDLTYYIALEPDSTYEE